MFVYDTFVQLTVVVYSTDPRVYVFLLLSYFITRSNTLPKISNSTTMCTKEHVFHACGHWGQDRFLGEPCVRSRIVAGRPTACIYKEIVGMANSKKLCPTCRKFAEDTTTQWSPSPWTGHLSTFSNAVPEHLQPKFRTRRLSLERMHSGLTSHGNMSLGDRVRIG